MYSAIQAPQGSNFSLYANNLPSPGMTKVTVANPNTLGFAPDKAHNAPSAQIHSGSATQGLTRFDKVMMKPVEWGYNLFVGNPSAQSHDKSFMA